MATINVSPVVLSAKYVNNSSDQTSVEIVLYWGYNTEAYSYVIVREDGGGQISGSGGITSLGDGIYQIKTPYTNWNRYGEKVYYMTINDINNNTSLASNTFTMFSGNNPTITDVNISDGDTIDTSWLLFSSTYNQAQDDPLGYCQYTLYDENDNVVQVGDKIFTEYDPPNVLPYYFEGFENNKTYKIGIYMQSQHGLETSDLISFNVVYDNITLYGDIDIERKCNDGYIKISSEIDLNNAETNPEPMEFITENYRGAERKSAFAIASDPIIQYGRDTSRWIYWGDRININTDFVLKFWFSLGTINQSILKLYNGNGDWVDIKFKRANISSIIRDYIEVTNSDGAVVNSTALPHRDSGAYNSRYFLGLKVVDNTWNITVSQTTPSILQDLYWNTENPTYPYCWNSNTSIPYTSEILETDTYNNSSAIANPNPFTKVILGNAICRFLEISNDITIDYTENVLDDWDENMVLRADFDGSIAGSLGSIYALRVKRKDDSIGSWVTLYEQEIDNDSHVDIVYKDYGTPKGIKQYYALVAVDSSGEEGNYIVGEVVPDWNATFIWDGEKCFKLYSSISYGVGTQNKPYGLLNPIGAKYPTVVENGDSNYASGMVSGQLMGYNFEKTRILDRVDVAKQTQDFVEFLNNGRSKIIYDWNGNCWLTRVVSSPSKSYIMQTTNGINTVAFNWVEQGKYNNQEDLEDNGLI